MSPRPYVDEAELLTIAGDERHVFIPSNLHEFETQFLKYVGFGCVGIELGPQARKCCLSYIRCHENMQSLVVNLHIFGTNY
jgi:hypothetical protein